MTCCKQCTNCSKMAVNEGYQPILTEQQEKDYEKNPPQPPKEL